MDCPGAAASVAYAEQHQSFVADALIKELLLRTMQCSRTCKAVIGFFGKHMYQHRSAVDTDPIKGMVWELVMLAPGKLLSHEIFQSALFHNLRQRCAVTEYIGQPNIVDIKIEFIFPEPCTLHNLTNQRFFAGDISIALYPHRALALDSALFDALLQSCIQIRIIQFHPEKQLRLGKSEPIFWVDIHQLIHGCKGTRTLTDCFADRPQPCEVDMRMSNSGDRQGSIAARFFHLGL